MSDSILPAQLTVRGLPPDLLERIRAQAKERGWSINRTVVYLLHEATATARVYTDLDDFFGGWSPAEADEFDEALARVRTVDPELWT